MSNFLSYSVHSPRTSHLVPSSKKHCLLLCFAVMPFLYSVSLWHHPRQDWYLASEFFDALLWLRTVWPKPSNKTAALFQVVLMRSCILVFKSKSKKSLLSSPIWFLPKTSHLYIYSRRQIFLYNLSSRITKLDSLHHYLLQIFFFFFLRTPLKIRFIFDDFVTAIVLQEQCDFTKTQITLLAVSFLLARGNNLFLTV